MFDPMDLLQACRRSRIKFRVYRALLSTDPALPGELADAAQTTIDRAEGVLHGDGRRFRFDTALVTLGAARRVPTGRGWAYVLTEEGQAAGAFVLQRMRPRE